MVWGAVLRRSANPQLQFLLRAQGGYYMATGLWPIVHFRSFEAVTGPKVDDWLVRMVGLLAATIGTALLLAAQRKNTSLEAVVLSLIERDEVA